jgi:hypothetical protein
VHKFSGEVQNDLRGGAKRSQGRYAPSLEIRPWISREFPSVLIFIVLNFAVTIRLQLVDQMDMSMFGMVLIRNDSVRYKFTFTQQGNGTT